MQLCRQLALLMMTAYHWFLLTFSTSQTLQHLNQNDFGTLLSGIETAASQITTPASKHVACYLPRGKLRNSPDYQGKTRGLKSIGKREEHYLLPSNSMLQQFQHLPAIPATVPYQIHLDLQVISGCKAKQQAGQPRFLIFQGRF